MDKEAAKNVTMSLVEALEDRKAKDVVVMDIEKISSIADYIIISTADSYMHLNSFLRYVDERAFEHGIKKLHPFDTNPENPWKLVDYGFVIVHLFTKEAREFYNLEKLWADGEIIYENANITYQQGVTF